MPTIRSTLFLATLCLFAACKRDSSPPADTAPATPAATETADDTAVPVIAAPTQVKQVTLALDMWSQDHHGDFTAEPRDLTSNGYLRAGFAFEDPDSKKPLYIFQHWTGEQAKKLSPSAIPIVWTNAPDDTYPLNVGYMDGRVESHHNKSTVNKQLEAAKNILMGKTPAAP